MSEPLPLPLSSELAAEIMRSFPRERNPHNSTLPSVRLSQIIDARLRPLVELLRDCAPYIDDASALTRPALLLMNRIDAVLKSADDAT